MMNVVSNTRVDIVARGVIKGCIESGRIPRETIAIFRIPGSWEDDGFKILAQVRRRLLRPQRVDVRGRRARRREAWGRARVDPRSRRTRRFIVQGITGREAVNLTRESLDYGAKIVGGVTPGPRRPRRLRRAGLRLRARHRRRSTARSTARSSRCRRASRATPSFEAIENGVKLIVIVTESIPRDEVAQMVELATLRGARIIGPNCLGIISPGEAKMGGLGGPGGERAPGLHEGPDRRHVALGRHDHRDREHAHRRRPRPVDLRLDRRRRDHRLDLRRADAALRGRPRDEGDRDLLRAGRPHGSRARRLGARSTARACRSSRSWPAASWTRCRACASATPARSSRARRTPPPRRSRAWRRPASRWPSASRRSRRCLKKRLAEAGGR